MAQQPLPAARGPAGSGRPAARSPAPRRTYDRPQCYAALDLGTNNCRLLIARPSEDGFIVIDAFSRIVRLGEGLAATGALGEAAMNRAVAALTVCADKLKRRHVFLVRSVATEACRRASNGRAFVDRVRAETGIQLEIISAEQEARLAVIGCHALLEPGEGPALVFDIGGGSTELVLLDGEDSNGAPKLSKWHSASWGVVSLSESEPHLGGDEAELRAAYERMCARVRESFEPFVDALASARIAPSIRLLGTSGTVTTLASLHLDLPRYDRRAVDGLVVEAAAMRSISQRLAGMPVTDRAKLPSIGDERADLVVAGCAILETILDLWPAERLAVADRGIREGILRTLMGNGR